MNVTENEAKNRLGQVLAHAQRAERAMREARPVERRVQALATGMAQWHVYANPSARLRDDAVSGGF